MKGLTQTGIISAASITALFILDMSIESPVDAYHPDITNFGMDAGVLMGYQVMILSMFLVGYKRLNDWILISTPFLAFALYHFEVANWIAHQQHLLMDGIYTGENSQDVAFDKQAVPVNFITLSTMILLGYYFSKSERSWDRSFFLLINLAMIWVIIAYHVALYFKVWEPYISTHRQFIEDFREEVLSGDLTCVTAYQIECNVISSSKDVPETEFYKGNPKVSQVHELAEAEYSFSPIDLYHSSVDDTYQRMFISLGVFMHSEGKNIMLYSNQLTPHFMALANMLGSTIAAFLFIWLYTGAFLSLFHRKFQR